MERSVRVINQVGKQNLSFNTTAENNEQLQLELSRYGISSDGLLGVIGETQVKLNSPSVQLPSHAFTVFLFPIKVESGCKIAFNFFRHISVYYQSRIRAVVGL